MGITAKELAEKLNLSAAAVSMALHNKPGVSTQTRQLVYDTALKYGFDFSKISEKKQVDGSIYLVIYQKHGTVVADTPFFSKVIEGVSLGCKNQYYKMKTSYIYEEEDTLMKQIEDIQYIRDTIGLEKLSEGLEEIARLRLEHPDASLKELGEMLSLAVGKSGVNHRLRKLSELADSIRGKG